MEYLEFEKLFYKDRTSYTLKYKERFDSEFTLHIPIKVSGNDAFVVSTGEILNLVSNIYKADKTLYMLVEGLPSIALKQFTQKCLVDEIKLTNDIEGVHSTRKEIKELLNLNNTNNIQKRLDGLVYKYAMLLGDDNIAIDTCGDIRNLYNDLVLKEVLEEDEGNAPGGVYFRKDSVSIQASDLTVIHYGITPEEEIIKYMDEGLKFLNNEKVNRLVSIAVFHYLVGYIHPFYDGNGRLSRFISSYCLSKELQPLIGLNLSYTIKQNIKTYNKAFSIVNDEKNKGDLTPFVISFLELINKSIEQLCSELQNKIE